MKDYLKKYARKEVKGTKISKGIRIMEKRSKERPKRD